MENLFLGISESPYRNEIILAITIWTVFWKGLALWKSARDGNKYWFLVILIFNTSGFLEIIYLLLKRYKVIKPMSKTTSLAAVKERESSPIKKRKKAV